MIIYRNSVAGFINDIENDTIVQQIEENFHQKMGWSVSDNEIRSWENSLRRMYIVLNDKEIPLNASVVIEYNVPLTSKRIDVMIMGYGADGKWNVIVIELKQWEKLEAVDSADALVRTYVGGGLRTLVHPSYQAWSYAAMIRDYNMAVQEKNINIYSCSYLHNYNRQEQDPLDVCQYGEYLQDTPAFTKGQVHEFRQFIKKFIVAGDDGAIAAAIDSGRIRPSKSLQNSVGQMLKGNKEFIMLDDQKVVYEEILRVARQAKRDHKKRVMIIEGGPGTGKSVVAVNALVQLTGEKQSCQYVSKNSAPRNVYQKKLKGEIRKSSVDNLFKGSGVFVGINENEIDTLLVDEAHRLNEKSGLFQNMGENQIKEIIHASKCSIFFIDESQRVTLRDIGRVEEIKKYTQMAGAEIYRQELVSQFRCNGSDGYLAWLDDVLGIRMTANNTMKGINYDIRIMDSPNEMRKLIEKENEKANSARILAGYCWDWDKNNRNNPEHFDITIDDFKISWNLNNTSTYAIDKDSVKEAGCIHTTQGLEFDYVGVIIGPDMRYENGRVITDYTKRAKTDQSLKGIKKMRKKDPERAEKLADEIIRNTYRTLMTRGMKGCYVYCVDKNLAEYLKGRI